MINPSKPGWWRMPEPCHNCPWSNSAEGKALRETLNPEFLAEVEAKLLKGGHFLCHASYYAPTTPKGMAQLCAGAIAWQEDRGVTADAVQVMTRLDELMKKENLK